MLLENANFDVNAFQKEFKDKFLNFCKKAPLMLEFQFLPYSVIITDVLTKKKNTFEFDYSKQVKQNIRDIYDWLVDNKYPIMTRIITKERNLTTEEIEECSDNEDIDSVLTKKKMETIEANYQVDKIINTNSTIIIRNMYSEQLTLHKVKIPSVYFLRKILEEKDLKKRYMFFKLNTKFEKVIGKKKNKG